MKTTALLALTLALGTLAPSGRARADVTEPETKIQFSESLSDGGMTYGLSGVGVREKLGFDVYAVGLYLEKGAGAAALKGWLDAGGKGLNAGGKLDLDKAKGDMKLFNFILDGKFGRAIWIKMARSVSGPKIKDGFIDSLSKNLDINGADVKGDVEKLATFLASAEAAKGGEYKFFFSADGTLSCKGPGGSFTVKNEKLVRGFLGNWIGQNPIHPKLRANLAGELNNLIK